MLTKIEEFTLAGDLEKAREWRLELEGDPLFDLGISKSLPGALLTYSFHLSNDRWEINHVIIFQVLRGTFEGFQSKSPPAPTSQTINVCLLHFIHEFTDKKVFQIRSESEKPFSNEGLVHLGLHPKHMWNQLVQFDTTNFNFRNL